MIAVSDVSALIAVEYLFNYRTLYYYFLSDRVLPSKTITLFLTVECLSCIQTHTHQEGTLYGPLKVIFAFPHIQNGGPLLLERTSHCR